jgi:hypothetical protein
MWKSSPAGERQPTSLRVDEARRIAIDLAKLPELLKSTRVGDTVRQADRCKRNTCDPP